MAMLLPSPKSSNDKNGAIYITELHNNKKGWELGMPFFWKRWNGLQSSCCEK